MLSLPRPDGTARTWWRMPVDEVALADDALEAAQNSVAALDSLDPALLVAGKLEGFDWKNGLKVADWSYFNGHTLTIDHPDEGWTEEKPIPRCPEAKVLEAVASAVKAGRIWLTSGAASVWGDTPPAGIVSKTAVLRSSPDPISVSSSMARRQCTQLSRRSRRNATLFRRLGKAGRDCDHRGDEHRFHSAHTWRHRLALFSVARRRPLRSDCRKRRRPMAGRSRWVL